MDTSSFTIVTIYALDGCPECRTGILSFINNNKSVLSELPFYLILSGVNSKSINRELKNYNLNDFKNLIIDNEGIARRLNDNPEIKNPRLTIVKESEVVSDSIYQAIDIERVF